MSPKFHVRSHLFMQKIFCENMTHYNLRNNNEFIQPRVRSVNNGPGGDSLLVSDGGSDIFWVCKTLSSIPLGTRFGA